MKPAIKFLILTIIAPLVVTEVPRKRRVPRCDHFGRRTQRPAAAAAAGHLAPAALGQPVHLAGDAQLRLVGGVGGSGRGRQRRNSSSGSGKRSSSSTGTC